MANTFHLKDIKYNNNSDSKCARLELHRLVFALLFRLAAANAASATRSDEADFATGACAALDGRWMANMLMIATAVRMFDGILSDTSANGTG